MRYIVTVPSVYGSIIFCFLNYEQLKNFVYSTVHTFDCGICKIYDAVDDVFVDEELVYMSYVEDHQYE